MKRIFLYTFILFVFNITAAFAEAINSYDISISVNTDNSIFVTESIVYDFEGQQRHGIFRNILLDSAGPRHLKITDVSVVDENDTPYQFQTYIENGEMVIKIGNPHLYVSGVKTYQISYKALNAISHYEGRDEIYWNAIGTQWKIPIRNISVTVQSPENTEIIAQSCYTGLFQEASGCANSDGLFTVEMLNPYEALTIAVAFPDGIINPYQPTIWQKYKKEINIGGIIFSIILPLVTFIFLFRRWYKYGRDPKGSRIIVPQYDVPHVITPLEAGYLVLHKNDNEFISAHLIYLAVNGYIVIHQEEKMKVLGVSLQKTYSLEYKKPYDGTDPVSRNIMDLMFRGESVGSKVPISKIGPDLLFHTSSIFKLVREQLVQKGYLPY